MKCVSDVDDNSLLTAELNFSEVWCYLLKAKKSLWVFGELEAVGGFEYFRVCGSMCCSCCSCLACSGNPISKADIPVVAREVAAHAHTTAAFSHGRIGKAHAAYDGRKFCTAAYDTRVATRTTRALCS